MGIINRWPTLAFLDGRYVNVTGDTITGDLHLDNDSVTAFKVDSLAAGNLDTFVVDTNTPQVTITAPLVCDIIIFGDDDYIGHGAGLARLVFDSTPNPDEIHLEDATFDFGANLITGTGPITTTNLGTFGNLDVDTLNFNGNVISDSTGKIDYQDDFKTDRWIDQDSNTFFGVGVIGAGNLSVGVGGLRGLQNTAFGSDALNSITEGYRNTAVGYSALKDVTTAVWNTAVGTNALENNTGSANTAVGNYALQNSSATHNTGIGYYALQNASGSYNVAIGSQALIANTSGVNNTGIGRLALQDNEDGDSNLGLAFRALYTNVDGSENTAIGAYSSYLNVSGSNNLAIGSRAGYTSLGDSNIFLGNYAGYRQTGSNIFIIDNQQRADIATEATNAILYGTMAATPIAQALSINAVTTTSQSRIHKVTRETASTTLDASDEIVMADSDGGAITITLPAGIVGLYYRIANTGTSGNAVTIDGNGAETVLGALTQILADGEILDIYYESTEGWW